MDQSGLPAGDTLSWREEGSLERRDSIHKNAFRSECHKCGSGWDGGVKMEGGQVGTVEYIYSAICFFGQHLCHQSCLRSCVKGWRLPLIADSEYEGLECQTGVWD